MGDQQQQRKSGLLARWRQRRRARGLRSADVHRRVREGQRRDIERGFKAGGGGGG